MIGCSRNELAFFKLFQKDFPQNAPAISDSLFGKNSALAKNALENLIQEYKSSHNHLPSEDIQADMWVRVITDYMYRMYSYRLARRLMEKGNQVWQYHVELPPALHCADQFLAFGGTVPAGTQSAEEKLQSKKLGEKIFRSFIQFVKHGYIALENNIDNKHLPAYLRNWFPLTPEVPKAMYWDVHSKIREIPVNDVLDGFPEDVYQL